MQTQPLEDLQERKQSEVGLYESDQPSDKVERGVQEFGSWNCDVCFGMPVGDMEISGQIETMRVSAEKGCSTCSFLCRGIQKIEIARHQDHVRQSSLSPSQDLCMSRTMSFSQSNSPALISTSSEQAYRTFRATMSMSRNLQDDILHVELGSLEDYEPWLGQVVDMVEFYTKSSEIDSTRRDDHWRLH
jgi:hypothetical protein